MKKRKVLLIAAITLHCIGLQAQQVTPEAEKKAETLVKQMTLREKIDYIGGYNDFYIRPVPRLGIPEIRMADGPQGVRNDTKSTLYPSGIATTATWSRDLMNKVGEGLGMDCRARGVHILLGPGVNLYRSPLCGRNFEYFGEDPYLASETAVQYIKGVQAQGVMATAKHFAGNNQEYNRHHVSSDIDKRTLNEVYLTTFRKAVQQAKVGALMNSYNLLNGVHASENEYLNIDILRNMWGFKGILMSDWVSVYSAVGAANGGLDLEMPAGAYMNYENISKAISTGIVSEKTIDNKVKHILQTLIAFGFFDRPQLDKNIPEKNPHTENIALQIAREGIVMLKNDNQVLPIKGKTLVMGLNANTIPTGGGSGFVTPFTQTSLCQGLQSVGKKSTDFSYLIDPELQTNLAKDAEFFTDATLKTKGLEEVFFNNKTLSGNGDRKAIVNSVDYNWHGGKPFEEFGKDNFSARWSGVFRAQSSGRYKFRVTADDGYRMYFDGKEVFANWTEHGFLPLEVEITVEAGKIYPVTIEYYESGQDAAAQFSYIRMTDDKLAEKLKGVSNVILNLGLNSQTEGEDSDRPFELPANQIDLINRIASLHKNIIVVINAGGAVEVDSWKDKVQAILMAWYPGQQGGQALAEIITGKISPCGKLPITFERKASDNPSFDNYVDHREKAIHKRVQYNEGIFQGYKGFDKSGIAPLYPFGFGLSYSSFTYSNLKIEKQTPHSVKLSFELKNTGKMDAAEIAQVYVGDPVCSVPRPLRELKGFEKVFLHKGETKQVSITLSDEAFSFFDVESSRFVVEPGEFIISVGASSRDIKLSGSVTL